MREDDGRRPAAFSGFSRPDSDRRSIPRVADAPMSGHSSMRASSGFSRSFHVVADPVGALCDLDCTNCYDQHKDGFRAGSVQGAVAVCDAGFADLWP